MVVRNVPAAYFLNASNDPTVALLDRFGTDAASNPTPARVQSLLDCVRTKLLNTNPTPQLLHDPQQLQIWAACGVNLCEVFRIRRDNVHSNLRLQTILFNFWVPYQRWVERLFKIVLDMDMDESELCITVAGLHDVWDLIGLLSDFISQVVSFPLKAKELGESDHHPLQVRLWVKIRACSRPRRDVEERIGLVMDFLMPAHERWQRNDVYEAAVASFTLEFMLQCLRRTIARIQSPLFGKSESEGGDTWTSCMVFTDAVTVQSNNVFLLYYANRCLFWEVTAFRRQVARRSEVHGPDAYYEFWPRLIQGVRRTFGDSPLWMPQAIDAGLLELFFRSRLYLQMIEDNSPPPLTPGATTTRMMATTIDELAAGIMHRQVLRKTSAAMRSLRKRHGDNVVDEAFKEFPRIQRSWRYLLRRLSELDDFRSILKDTGEGYSECANIECQNPDAAASLRCGGCEQVFYCSPKCRKLAWPGHRRQCKEDTVLREKGDIRRLDDRSEAFAIDYVQHLLSEVGEYKKNWEDAVATYADVSVPKHFLIADVDFTKMPFTLCAANAMTPIYKNNKNWEREVRAAREENWQLVHITIPFIVDKPEKILVGLYIGDGSSDLESK